MVEAKVILVLWKIEQVLIFSLRLFACHLYALVIVQVESLKEASMIGILLSLVEQLFP